MDLKQIKELMAAMDRAGMKKLSIKQKSGEELHLEKQDEVGSHHAPPQNFYPSFYAHPPAREAELHKPHTGPKAAEAPSTETAKPGKFVTAPLVGTFYSAPSPEDSVFVKIGDRVTEDTVVCIIEAMKVMNEVKAGFSGTIAEMLVDNGHPVEFGTKLFRIT